EPLLSSDVMHPKQSGDGAQGGLLTQQPQGVQSGAQFGVSFMPIELAELFSILLPGDFEWATTHTRGSSLWVIVPSIIQIYIFYLPNWYYNTVILYNNLRVVMNVVYYVDIDCLSVLCDYFTLVIFMIIDT